MKNKYYRLVEDENDMPSSGKTRFDVSIEPLDATVEDAVAALEDIENYGIYAANIRNAKGDIEKAVIDHFGPNSPATKKRLEKERGEPFPAKTRAAMDDFIKTLKAKPNLLKWVVVGDTLVFPLKNNPYKKVIEKIVDTVMTNANIRYHLTDVEPLNEYKLLKKLVKEVLSEEESKLDKYYTEILELIRKAARDLNDDDAYELHEKLKKWFNKFI